MFGTTKIKKHLVIAIPMILLMWMMSHAAFGTTPPIVIGGEVLVERSEAEEAPTMADPALKKAQTGTDFATMVWTMTPIPTLEGKADIAATRWLDPTTTLTITWAGMKSLALEKWTPTTVTPGIPLALSSDPDITTEIYADAKTEWKISDDGATYDGTMAWLPIETKAVLRSEDDTRKAGTVLFGEKPEDTGGIAGVVAIDTGVFQQDRAFEDRKQVTMGEDYGADKPTDAARVTFHSTAPGTSKSPGAEFVATVPEHAYGEAMVRCFVDTGHFEANTLLLKPDTVTAVIEGNWEDIEGEHRGEVENMCGGEFVAEGLLEAATPGSHMVSFCVA